MNTNNVISGIAAADLSGKEYLAVRVTSTGLALAGVLDVAIGTILRGATTGRAVDIFLAGRFNGLHYITCGNATAIDAGDLLEAVAGGKYVKRRNLAVTATAADEVFTSAGHGYVDGTPVVLSALTGGAGLVAGQTYFVRDAAADTFKVAAVPGGTAVDVTSNLTAGTVRRADYQAIAWEALPASSADCQLRALLL